ncbi:hypothetical protein A1OQ_07795 [Enterovibrio norvegicus FF-162]|uniref:hypothetical protein n=1 Tax=Enterovibrio norvegicus TaxID=188144 RepID=UPI00036D6F7A|nr:hypothetical protein [Enterovibrio norvegicus]OEE75001.1 hypothetical protein A1OQ_07795 [Enterovibrio norvegicus FF-162]
MEELSEQIENTRRTIHEHYGRLDDQSVWFFVATLACWSVTVLWLQIVAMVLVFFYLFTQVFEGRVIVRSFGQELSHLRQSIEAASLSEDEKNQLLGQTWRVSNDYLTLSKTFRHTYRFVAAAIFYSLSCMQLILQQLNTF